MSAPARLRSESPAETEAIGAALGAVLRPGDVLALDGPLGAGKTCLVRGIVAGAGGDPAAVRSPTFVLHQPLRCPALVVHHIDLYRLGPGAGIDVLDLDSALRDGAAVVEWGAYADLGEFAPARIALDAPGPTPDRRELLLADGAPAHIANAWQAAASAVAR